MASSTARRTTGPTIQYPIYPQIIPESVPFSGWVIVNITSSSDRSPHSSVTHFADSPAISMNIIRKYSMKRMTLHLAFSRTSGPPGDAAVSFSSPAFFGSAVCFLQPFLFPGISCPFDSNPASVSRFSSCPFKSFSSLIRICLFCTVWPFCMLKSGRSFHVPLTASAGFLPRLSD